MSSLWVYFWTLKPTLNLHQAGSDKNFSLFYQKVLVTRASLVAQRVKNLPTKQKMRIRSLGRENSLEKRMATCSSILAWNSMDRGAWRTTVHRVAKSQTKLSDKHFHFIITEMTELIRGGVKDQLLLNEDSWTITSQKNIYFLIIKFKNMNFSISITFPNNFLA